MVVMAPERNKPRRRRRLSAFADKLKQIRDRLGLTQITAAERIGVAARTVIAWENDQTRPGRLAKILLHNAFPADFPKPK